MPEERTHPVRQRPEPAASAAAADPPGSVAASLPMPKQPPRWVRLLLNAFILWNLFAVTIWLLPACVLRQTCVSWVSPYMEFTGLAQNWNMFSPNPSDLDLYWEARIRYQDGQTRSWEFPRMTDLGYFDRYRRERFRKLVEFANPDTSRMVWPSLARYAARTNNSDPHNAPVSVELVRHFRTVPPPGGSFGPFRTFSFFKTAISPEDLK